MKPKRVDEYHKHGCNFFGKLVVVDYYKEMKKDPKWRQWNSGIVYDYIEKAEALVKVNYEIAEKLLAMPDYIVRVK